MTPEDVPGHTVSDSDEEPREAQSTMPFAAWTRPIEPGSDGSMAGPGSPPPGRTDEDVIAYRTVINTAIEQTQDVVHLLTDAAAARPGATAQVVAAINSLRIAADNLEVLTQPSGDQPGQDHHHDVDAPEGDGR